MKEHKEMIKVGSIVKKSYSAARKPTKRERAEYKYKIFMPIAGIVKKIYHSDVPGIENAWRAEIDWFGYEIPELSAITDPWDLEYERKHNRSHILDGLTLFEPYYKSFLRRTAEKKKKKESSLQAGKTVVE
jgi:hypothetical protein